MAFSSESFGKYKLLDRLAVGGMAEVFRARLVQPNGNEVQVVLKKVLPQHAEDPRFRQIFVEEARIMSTLSHDNVVGLRDFGELDGTFFLALEYVDGADLHRLLQRCRYGRLPQPSPQLAAYLMLQVCDALDYVHTRCDSRGRSLEIVHRDISPQNILIARDGTVKLTDFGIAKSTIRTDPTTGAAIKGKFAYMAPEQTMPGQAVDSRTDLFAVGIVLHELLVGRPPFHGASDADTLLRVRDCSYRLDPAQLPPTAQPLVPVVRRALRKDPDHRHPTAKALASELQQYLQAVLPRVTRQTVREWVAGAAARQSVGALDRQARVLLEQAVSTTVVAAHNAVPSRHVSDHRTDQAASQGAASKSSPSQLHVRRWTWTVAACTAAALLCATIAVFHIRRTPEPAQASRPTAARAVVGDAKAGIAAAVVPSDTSATSDAPSAVRQLTITSNPAGAEVWINGTSRGRTPLAIAAPHSAFRLELRRDGYRRCRRSYGASSRSARQLSVTLRRLGPRYGRITINSLPWATVYVDGKPIGVTPIRDKRLRAGQHHIVLKDRQGRILKAFTTHVVTGQERVHSFLFKRR